MFVRDPGVVPGPLFLAARAVLDAWFPVVVSALLVAVFALSDVAAAQAALAVNEFFDFAGIRSLAGFLSPYAIPFAVLGLLLLATLRHWAGRLASGPAFPPPAPLEVPVRSLVVLAVAYAPLFAFAALLAPIAGAHGFVLTLAAPLGLACGCELGFAAFRRRWPGWDLATAAERRAEALLGALALTAWLAAAVLAGRGSPSAPPWPAQLDAVGFARLLAPVGVVMLCVAAGAWIVSWIIIEGRRLGVPLLSLVLLHVGVLAFLAPVRNHAIAQLPARGDAPTSVAADPPPEAEAGLWAERLERWRAARAFPAGPRAPLIVVAAEGGGIRAAFFTAAALARIADRCPPLADRVFAISGVSGGSIGAALYAADLKADPPAPDARLCDFSGEGADAMGPRERRLSRMLAQDHLSPLLARGLFGEPVQALVPVAVPGADRQQALELSLVRAFQMEHPGRPDAWPSQAFQAFDPDPEAGFALPWLALTAVDAGQGRPVTASDLPLWFDPHGRVDTFAHLYPDKAFSLIALAGTSARFPFISPAGLVERPGAKAPDRYVDGTYFDNTGLWLADRIALRLRQVAPGAPVYVLLLSNTPAEPSGAAGAPSRQPARLDDLAAPLEGLLGMDAVREKAQGLRAVLEREDCGPDGGVCAGRLLVIRSGARPETQPLGWYYSARSACAAEIGLSRALADLPFMLATGARTPPRGPVEPPADCAQAWREALYAP